MRMSAGPKVPFAVKCDHILLRKWWSLLVMERVGVGDGVGDGVGGGGGGYGEDSTLA